VLRLCPLLLVGFIFVSFDLCFGLTRDVVCDDGDGRFETTFVSGVRVTVGPTKSGPLAKRSCSAALAWNGQELRVAEEASKVDVDVLGADLGFGVPVVAFQIRKFAADWDMTYQIYSLQRPPRLLRTITGGDFFSAADTDLKGSIEIWTGDVRAISGFEDLVPGELDFAPRMVLRFRRNQLMDVSGEFQGQFDTQIAKVRTEITAQDLSNFRNSDGKLSGASSVSADRIHRLRTTKIKVLEIVWAYLYSGRDEDAWRALANMWPAADFERIRSAVLTVRDSGIRSEIDGISPRGPRLHFKRHAYVFDAITEPPQGNAGHFPFVDIRPQPILLRRPPPAEGQQPLAHSTQMVTLVIDAAGKVWSAEPVGDADRELVDAAAGWKFIPAFTGGQAVASRIRLDLSNYR
jgi:hypothetical protein